MTASTHRAEMTRIENAASGPSLHRVGFGIAWIHLLVDDTGVVIIDSGLCGEHLLVERRLRKLGRSWSDVKAIILTHGHLDHAGNAHRFKRLSGAPIYAHALEQQHIDGRYPYRGIARICGLLEALGRPLTRYRPVTIDVPIADGDVLPFWGGLRVMHLPGHSVGHCALYAEAHDLLFLGDLYADWIVKWGLPPWWFNSCPQQFAESYRRVMELNPGRVAPNHYIFFDLQWQTRRFKRWCASRWPVNRTV